LPLRPNLPSQVARPFSLPLASLSLLVAGCASSPRADSPADPNQQPRTTEPPTSTASNPWVACHTGFRPTGNPRGDLARITRACGRTSPMRPITKVLTQEQREQDPAHRYTFYVPARGACYRVYAAGDSGISDLDLLLRGPDGDGLAGDLSHDAWPILPPQGPLCFDRPGLYMLEVSVFRGAGTYAIQVWGG